MAVLPNDMLSPTFLLGAINTRPDRNAIRQNYIGEQLFSRRDVPERRLMWDSLVAENNLAGFYSPKGSAVPGSDLPFATHFADLIDLKASRYLDADLLQKVRDPGMPAIIKAAGDSFTVKAIQSRVAQLEYMAIGAITGSIVWPPRDANNAAIQFPMPHWNPEMTLTVNMGLDSNFNQNVTTLTGYGGRTGSGVAWNANGADPVLDLEIISEFMTEQVGVNSYGAKLVMSRATLSRIAFLPNVLRWLTGAVTVSGTSATAVNAFPAAGYADIETIKNFVSTKLGYDIVLYDAQWTYRTLNTSTGVETVNRVKFLKEGRVIILPKGFNVGYMAYAPHETQAGNWVTGKAPWVWQSDKPPIMRELGVNCVAFPIITYPSEIFNLNVYA